MILASHTVLFGPCLGGLDKIYRLLLGHGQEPKRFHQELLAMR